MNIAVIGDELKLVELKQKFGLSNAYVLISPGSLLTADLQGAEVVFDFSPTDSHFRKYESLNIPVFINTTFTTLSGWLKQFSGVNRDLVFGFCGLPTFTNRPVMEVTTSSVSKEVLIQTCLQLKTDFVCVEDRVGMVTPRVIAMIINEAYYTVEEGTASREDIDLAMKLGTNYPYGPFDWARQIGISNVVQLLDAVHEDTGDVRYEVCNLLRSEASE